MLTPDDKFRSMYFVVASWTYYAIIFVAIAVFFGRLGNWPEVLRRLRKVLVASPATAVTPSPSLPRDPLSDPAQWPQLRADGALAVADRLTADLRHGQMSDVDHARILHAWRSGRSRAEIADDVLRQGAAACAHGSGARDLPRRVARHDLTVRQVRIGVGVDDPERQAHPYRGAGIAVDPTLLATSALVVGPSDVETATRIVYPVAESLCLQALTGQAAVVAVSSSRGATPPDAAFDVVIRAGASADYCLDLYAGLDDADEAAGLLAEALLGDLSESLPGGDSRRAAAALAQLMGAWQAAHGALPGVADLRDLVDDATVRAALRADLDARGLSSHTRELETFERRTGGSGDLVDGLSNRLGLLDRPAVGTLLSSPRRSTGPAAVFSMQHLDRPVRVRVELPERAHAEASRVIARLVLAQFSLWAAARSDRALFAGLVVDDAVQLVTPQSLRALQRLRASNAGVLLTLRTLADVPQSLRDPLLGAVGCRIACAGISPWDAHHFTSAWGTEWVETRTITHRQVRAEEPLTKVLHGIRRVVTGKHVTSESVTVRREERQRWSASALANDLTTGHVVASFTTAGGERTPPILTTLDG
ncbi:ATP-binding protein [Streptomyces sp. NPDC015171]|uniref:ATP-binding protein n=1 Tax=Streptomyces sp. NPDC015171 TaxID=3364945 RepID=UPI0036F54559